MTDSAKAPSKGAWTPGPWVQDEEHYEDVYADSGELVVAAYPFVDAKRPEEDRIREQKANALLISKSPTMALLLREYRDQHDICNGDDESGECPCETCDEAERLLTELEGKL